MVKLLTTAILLSLFIIAVTNISCNQTAAQVNTKANFKEYKVILQEVNALAPNSEERFKTFESKVKSALSEGWTLVGGAADLGGYISQTIAR